MTKEEIIKMAREAGINFRPLDDDYCDMVGLNRGTICRVESIGDEEIKRFATMVAAAEREACAKLCEQVGEPNPDDPNSALGEYYKDSVCYECAEAIRARSNK